ncbi:prepilin-type N-terminal cleavage/methylation domain-containing protein [Chitinivorax sp. B]|uniref:type II secretion system protein n=1 Tax=Chitinivorax sp. B TaxID=2502235 RepID=UPI0010F4F082|nr:prepilin-type N-terminal cleavage/methylation domain-containing protein [Chitinivorax sp. B]
MRNRSGFTLIELLVVLAIIATLVTIVTPRYFNSVDRAKDATLRQNLESMRTAIDQYYHDRNRYPTTLQELVDQRYLRRIPTDPITERTDSWQVIQNTEGENAGVVDVKSGAKGESHDGKPYADW